MIPVEALTFDPIWEKKYSANHRQMYPWDVVVTFIFRHAPSDVARSQVKILEVGCGTGPNVWFAAREGFSVSGVDASETAIRVAKTRMAAEGLTAELRVADFSALPFADSCFDLVIDRAALTCCSRAHLPQVLSQIARVTKKGGKFLLNPYADSHSSFSRATQLSDGTTTDIRAGTLVGVGQVCFFSRRDVVDLLANDWQL